MGKWINESVYPYRWPIAQKQKDTTTEMHKDVDELKNKSEKSQKQKNNSLARLGICTNYLN